MKKTANIVGVFDTDLNAFTGIATPDGQGLTGLSQSGGVGATIRVNSRDGMGRVTSYTEGFTTYTVTYNSFGISTVSGNGQTTTYNYVNGLLSSTTIA